VESVARATEAVRQIEFWYQEQLDFFVQEGCVRQGGTPERPATVTPNILAFAHEQAWRHGIVRAQRSTLPEDWATMTVTHEAAAYEHLLSWAARTYDINEDDVRGAQTTRGYRHHPR
jgi:hypothetical protein